MRNRTSDDIMHYLCDNINKYAALDKKNAQVDMLNQAWKLGNDSMFEALKYFIDTNHFKDEFEYSYYYEYFGFHAMATSVKTKCRYNFTYYSIYNEFALSSYIENAYNIKNLQDDFLIDFFAESQRYGFAFIENSGFSSETKSEYPDLFKTFKGSIFMLMRNYFLKIAQHDDDLCDFGSWEKKWDINTPIYDMFEEAPHILRAIYKFNYNLWKIDDLKTKKHLKNKIEKTNCVPIPKTKKQQNTKN